MAKPMYDARPLPMEGAVDADGHVLEPTDLWEEYIDPQYRDRALRFVLDELARRRDDAGVEGVADRQRADVESLGLERRHRRLHGRRRAADHRLAVAVDVGHYHVAVDRSKHALDLLERSENCRHQAVVAHRDAAHLARDLGTVLHVHVAEDKADVDDARTRGYSGVIDRLTKLDAMVPGYPAITVTSSAPMSIPSSSALVETTQRTSPSRNPRSISRRRSGR